MTCTAEALRVELRREHPASASPMAVMLTRALAHRARGTRMQHMGPTMGAHFASREAKRMPQGPEAGFPPPPPPPPKRAGFSPLGNPEEEAGRVKVESTGLPNLSNPPLGPFVVEKELEELEELEEVGPVDPPLHADRKVLKIAMSPRVAPELEAEVEAEEE